MGIFELLAIIPWLIATFGAFIPFVIYVVARWREDKGGPPDPQLGFATIYGLVAYLGFTVANAGLCTLLGAIFQGGTVKVGFPLALMFSGALVFAPAFLAVKAKTAGAPSRASRLYVGLVVLASSVISAGLVVAIAMMLAAEARGRDLAQPIAVLVVNLPIAIVGGSVIARPRTPERAPT